MNENAAFSSGEIEGYQTEETTSLTLTTDDLNIGESAMIGVGLGGSAILTSLVALVFLSIMRRS